MNEKSIDYRFVLLYYVTSTTIQEIRRLAMAWNFEQDKPIYIQIVNRIQLGILSGEYKPGQRLDSVRDLAAQAGVNPNTMQKSLQELENIKLIYSQRTAGRYITEDENVIGKLRKIIAEVRIRTFIDEMKTLGYSIEEIEEMIKSYHEMGDSKAVTNLEEIMKEEKKNE